MQKPARWHLACMVSADSMHQRHKEGTFAVPGDSWKYRIYHLHSSAQGSAGLDISIAMLQCNRKLTNTICAAEIDCAELHDSSRQVTGIHVMSRLEQLSV